MSETDYVSLAVRGGMNPWGHVLLADLITAVRVKRQEQFQNNLQLAKMVGAMFAGRGDEIKGMVPKD